MTRPQYPDSPAPSSSLPERIGEWFLLIARLAGVGLTIIGVAILLSVLVEAWNLYQHPAGIVSLAVAIEAATAIDATLLGESVGKTVETHTISYFLAWTLAIALLSLIGRVAFWAINAGGGLLTSRNTAVVGAKRQPTSTSAAEIQLPPDYRPTHRVAGSAATTGHGKQVRIQPRD